MSPFRGFNQSWITYINITGSGFNILSYAFCFLISIGMIFQVSYSKQIYLADDSVIQLCPSLAINASASSGPQLSGA